MVTHFFKELYAYRELLFAMTYRDIRVKYKQAVMGMLWAFFLPVLAISSGIVFRLAMAYFSGQSPQLRDMVGVMVKSVPWLLFAGIVGSSSNSLVGSIGLITKIYFPREIVPVSSLLSSLFDFVISLTGLVVILAVIYFFSSNAQPPIAVGWSLLWVPVLLAMLVFLAAGLGLFLACANLFLRDVKYIVQVVLQFGIFFSLVYFTYEELGQWGWILLINPVAPILEGLRTAAIDGAIDPTLLPWLGYSAVVTLVGFMAACAIFERAEYLFAEYI